MSSPSEWVRLGRDRPGREKQRRDRTAAAGWAASTAVHWLTSFNCQQRPASYKHQPSHTSNIFHTKYYLSKFHCFIASSTLRQAQFWCNSNYFDRRIRRLAVTLFWVLPPCWPIRAGVDKEINWTVMADHIGLQQRSKILQNWWFSVKYFTAKALWR